MAVAAGFDAFGALAVAAGFDALAVAAKSSALVPDPALLDRVGCVRVGVAAAFVCFFRDPVCGGADLFFCFGFSAI